MANTDNYIETEKGHVDAREKNFESENIDPHLGFDPEIEVPG